MRDPGKYIGIDAGIISLDIYLGKFEMRWTAWLPIFCVEYWRQRRPPNTGV
jgi:hypothetical protein